VVGCNTRGGSNSKNIIYRACLYNVILIGGYTVKLELTEHEYKKAYIEAKKAFNVWTTSPHLYGKDYCQPIDIDGEIFNLHIWLDNTDGFAHCAVHLKGRLSPVPLMSREVVE